MSHFINDRKKIINCGNSLSSAKSTFRNIDSGSKSSFKVNEKIPQIINYSYHISEEENKDEIIKILKEKILFLEQKINNLEEKLTFEKNKKKKMIQSIINSKQVKTINTEKQNILFNNDLSRNELPNFLKKTKIKKNLSMRNLFDNRLTLNQEKKKKYNSGRSLSQLEKRTQIKVLCKERKFSPLFPKIKINNKVDSITNSLNTLNFSNNSICRIDKKARIIKSQFDEQLNKIKLRTEILLKKCFNM